MNNEIISKVEKLLSLAGNNPSQAEAEAAMLKAQQLMAKHNLTMENLGSETKKKEAVQEFVNGGHKSAWARGLGKVISENFRCTVLIVPGYGLTFIGLRDDLDICLRVYNFACHTLDRNMSKLRRQYRKEGKATDGVSGDYAAGFIKGLHDKFAEQVKSEGYGLILVKDEAVTEFVDKVKSSKSKARKGLNRGGNPEVFLKGYQDGKNIGEPNIAIES